MMMICLFKVHSREHLINSFSVMYTEFCSRSRMNKQVNMLRMSVNVNKIIYNILYINILYCSHCEICELPHNIYSYQSIF
jgi:hypothetical protein